MEQLCHRCGQEPRLSYIVWCRRCKNAHARATRPKHSQLSPEARRKANVRSTAKMAQRRGALVPQPCERCRDLKVQKHHDDYSEPLAVRWFCARCHREHERNRKAE